MKPTFSLLDNAQSINTSADYRELLNEAEAQYGIVEKMYWLFQETLDFDFYDLYLARLAAYAKQIQQIRLVNPKFIERKLKEVLAQVNQLWPEYDNKGITIELVAKVDLLLDTAAALGWNPPKPEVPIYNCEVCGYKGHLGVDIIEGEYYDRVLKRDSIRWECKDIEKCLDRKELRGR